MFFVGLFKGKVSMFKQLGTAIPLAAVACTSFCLPNTSFADNATTSKKSLKQIIKELMSSNLVEQEKEAVSLLASNCDLDAEKLRNMLNFKVLDKKAGKEVDCELIPLFECEEQEKCFLNLYSYAREDYMQYYWTSGSSIIEPNIATNFFHNSVRKMSQKCPHSVTFAVKFNGEYVGLVSLGALYGFKGADAYLSYVIDEKYSGRGITKRCASVVLDFLEYLVNSGNSCYKGIKRLRGLGKIANKATNAILKKNGFVLNEGEPSAPLPSETNEYFYYLSNGNSNNKQKEKLSTKGTTKN